MIWNAKNGSVKIGDTEMEYVSFGSGSKTLIILPGLSDGLATVKGKALLLAPPYRMFFNDFTVYMFSRKTEMPQGHTIRSMADDQAEALRELGVIRASVLGVSQGGMIALCLACYHSEMVEKLVVAVSSSRTNELITTRVSKWIRLAKAGDHKQLMIDTAENSYSDNYLRKYRKVYPVIGHVGKPSDYRRFLINSDAILGFNISEDLRKISCPTLIIGGEEDKIVGIQASYEMNSGIAGSKLFVYPGLGHAAYEEAKDFNQKVYDFLK